jgi:hypothetical protein
MSSNSRPGGYFHCMGQRLSSDVCHTQVTWELGFAGWSSEQALIPVVSEVFREVSGPTRRGRKPVRLRAARPVPSRSVLFPPHTPEGQ